jgi:light-regulated signal transduction histidine kinase (bacteriophytochrome)
LTGKTQTPTWEHDMRMHLGVMVMALQMLTRPPTTPLQPDQKELIDIIQRATKSLQDLVDNPPSPTIKKTTSRRRVS